MSATLEEQTLEPKLGASIPMGDDSHELELVDELPMLEALQNEVLMRNMPGFVS